MLPKLTSKWQAATFSKQHLLDLVEVTHVTLKLLDIGKRRYIAEGVLENRTGKRRSQGLIETAKHEAATFDLDK